MEKLNIKVREGKEELLEEDPLNTKGTGILGFREITLTSTWLFLVLSLICLPIFFIYKNGTEANNNHILKHSLFGKFTLGNLG
jgi:hypothetical protein